MAPGWCICFNVIVLVWLCDISICSCWHLHCNQWQVPWACLDLHAFTWCRMGSHRQWTTEDSQSLVLDPSSSGAHPECEYMVWNEKLNQSQTAINQHSFPVQFFGLPSKLFVHAYTTLCPCSSYPCDAHRGRWLSSHYTRRFLVQAFVLKAGDNSCCV